jgi:hypothetical protein
MHELSNEILANLRPEIVAILKAPTELAAAVEGQRLGQQEDMRVENGRVMAEGQIDPDSAILADLSVQVAFSGISQSLSMVDSRLTPGERGA